ncbi:hypothetical protein [Rheinheimera texasensis]|uniref:jacalin-like lectin n=1 Tax=Rheinheimera texasensis TaxID=306205 RepID=UPI0032B1D44A
MLKRYLILVLLSFFLISDVLAGSITKTCGGMGGNEFAPVSPRKVGFRGADFVDSIFINGHKYGGDGGNATDQYLLDPDDFWSEIVIRSGDFVDHMWLKSNKGVVVTAGNPEGGNLCVSLKGGKVVSIGGRTGQFLDQASVEYIENYDPRQEITRGYWALVCSGVCDKEIITGFVNSTGTRIEKVDEVVRTSFEASMKGSIFEGGVSGSTSGSAISQSTRNTLEQTFSNSSSGQTTERIKFSPEQMQRYGVAAVWQWTMRNADNIWSTPFKACTPTDQPPTWEPGSGKNNDCSSLKKD